MKVYALYGAADRGEFVLMFFKTKAQAREFIEDLPGRYRLMKVKGVDYDSLKCAPARLED